MKATRHRAPCAVEGCGSPLEALGLCNKHYIRQRLTGTTKARLAWFDQTEPERFWSKVAKAGPDECWLWLIKSDLNTKGYARFSIYKRGGRKRVLAHRYSFALANGPIPSGVVIMHTCDTPLCVNPGHLKAGTQLDNIRDAMAKGRMDTSGLALGWAARRKKSAA